MLLQYLIYDADSTQAAFLLITTIYSVAVC